MDRKDLEKLIKETTQVDNKVLEELMSQELTVESQNEFLRLFKDSQLFMPVTYSENMFEGIENAKPGDIFQPEGRVGFDINYLTGKNGSKAVPLFTSSEIMEKAGIQSSANIMFMSDLADMMKQTDRYSAVVVNPFTDMEIDIPMDVFLNLFFEPTFEEKKAIDALDKLLKFIKENSIEMDENATLFLRSDENIMVDAAVDGVFIPKLPFYVSSNPKQGEDLKYTNILLMPKSKRFLPIGPDEELDIIIAPGTEFRLEDVLDETQNLWMCGAQPFYDD